MPDKEIEANISQLKGAFRAHGRTSEDGATISHRLMQFYANECGLKALFLIENKLDNTGDLLKKTGKKYGHGHDLVRWASVLKLPSFALRYLDHEHEPVRQVHEKLRYGVTSNNRHDDFLKSLYTFLKKYLR